MATKEIEVELGISRYTSNQEPCEGINIRISDKTSGIEFVEIELTLEEFGRLVTGGSRGKVKAKVRGLESVGKTMEREKAQTFISTEDYDRLTSGPYSEEKERLGAWLKTAMAREGWHVSTYLGSRGSIEYAAGGKIINFGYYRYVDKSNG